MQTFQFIVIKLFELFSYVPKSLLCLPVSFHFILVNISTKSCIIREQSSDQEKRGRDVTRQKTGLFHIHNLYLNFFLFLQTERTYFQVFLPKGSKEKSKPMFFCHRWSIGKVIDFAASLASLKNDNNRLTAKVTTRQNDFSLKLLGYAVLVQVCLFVTV